jgi:UDP-N-acetyl-D-glucosamine dehydrogenase
LLVATDLDGIDWNLIADNVPVVVDTRNVFARAGIENDKIVKA